MFSAVHELCRLEHVYGVAGLKLISSCSLKFSSDANYSSSLSAFTNLFESLAAAGVWVTRGNGLRLRVRLSEEIAALPHDSVPDLGESLGVTIRDLEIWRRLNLKLALIILPSPQRADYRTQDLVFTLDPLDVPNVVPNISAPHGCSMLYTNPPDGVPVAHLDTLDVLLTISAAPHPNPLYREGNCVYGSTDYQTLTNRLDAAKDRNIDNHFHDGLYGSSFPDRHHLDEDCNLVYDAAHSSQNSILWSDSSQRIISSHSSWISNAVQNIDSPTTIESEASCLNHLSRLADAALRTMIGGDGATVATKGIRLFSYSEGPKLAEIAPALFSPDYAMVLSQRSVLFPTIARGLSAIYGRTRSFVLKDKIDQLTQLSLEERLLLTRDNPDFEAYGRKPSSLKSVLKLRLWKLAQRRLYDPKSTRQLKPIEVPRGLLLREIAPDAMLDEIDLAHTQSTAATSLDCYDCGIAETKSTIEDEGLMLEADNDVYDDYLGCVLGMARSVELYDELLDTFPQCLHASIGEEDMFLGEDEILDQDEDEDEEMLNQGSSERHIEDADIDLFQES